GGGRRLRSPSGRLEGSGGGCGGGQGGGGGGAVAAGGQGAPPAGVAAGRAGRRGGTGGGRRKQWEVVGGGGGRLRGPRVCARPGDGRRGPAGPRSPAGSRPSRPETSGVFARGSVPRADPGQTLRLGPGVAGGRVVVDGEQPPVRDGLTAVHEGRGARGRRAEDEGGDRVGDGGVGEGVHPPQHQVGQLAGLQGADV